MAKLTREQFQVLRIKSEEALRSQKKQVLICAGTGCIAGGSLQIYDYIKAECERRGLDVYVGLQEETGILHWAELEHKKPQSPPPQ